MSECSGKQPAEQVVWRCVTSACYGLTRILTAVKTVWQEAFSCQDTVIR